MAFDCGTLPLAYRAHELLQRFVFRGNPMPNAIRFFSVFVLSLVLTACGGGGGGSSSDDGGGGSGGGGDAPSSSVGDVLDKLNVDTTETPRVDSEGDALPDSYAPFGTTVSTNRFVEVAVIGVPIDDSSVSESGSEVTLTNLVPQSGNRFSWELLSERPASETPWSAPDARRGAAIGDFDGDGLDEIAVVYQTDGDVLLVFIDDAEDGYAISSTTRVDRTTVNEIFVAAADFDGDVDIDLAVGLVSTLGSAEIKLIDNLGSSFAFNGVSVSIPRRSFAIGELVMKPGNFDHDAPIELAVAVNAGSIEHSFNSIAETESWYSLYDDGETGLRTLRSNGQLEVDIDSGTRRAAITNLDTGDVDGDNLDEIVLGGLNQSGSLSDGYSNFRNFIGVIDDAKADFAERIVSSDSILTSDDGNYQPRSSGASQSLNHVPVVTADVDGDGSKEFLVGQHLYQSLTASGGSLAYYDDANPATDDDGRARIPATEWFGEASSGMRFNFSWNRYAVAAGDVTLDGRENIVLYTQRRATVIGDTQAVQVWGDDQVKGWSKIQSYANQRASDSVAYNPQVLLPDAELDDGSAMLSYSSGSHRLVFTEPVVLAAIAASPCSRDLGQDLTESCRSAYGTALSSSEQVTDGSSFSWRASAGMGLSVPTNESSLEITAAFEKRTREWTTNAYSVTKSLVYETGAIEDTVVFSSVPLDVYTYTVLSHVDPQLVGTTVDIRLPREAVTLMVTREKYNSAVLDDSVKIDDRIFEHTIGDPGSYPSRADKSSLLSRYDGIEGTSASVGEGLGQTISTINALDTTTNGESYEKEGSVNIRGTFGNKFAYVIGEVNFAIGTDASVEISHGTESIYQGSVGNITSDDFDAGRSYNWGLFSYIYDGAVGQPPFEVINFWVEQP